MAQSNQLYSMGHGKEATSSHASRTAENDAAFALRHVTTDHYILDVGCGPGTITTGFCKYVPQGFVTGIDISPEVLFQAADIANADPKGCPSNLDFFAVDVLKPGWADDKPEKMAKEPSALPKTWIDRFDMIYESNVFMHLPDPVAAMKKLRPCLKEYGMFALRDYDLGTFIFHPDPTGKLHRWAEFQGLIMRAQGAPSNFGGRDLYRLVREAGFSPKAIQMTTSSMIYHGPEQRKWWGQLHAERWGEGKGQRKLLIEKCGVTAQECDEIREALLRWVDEPDGFFHATAFEIIART